MKVLQQGLIPELENRLKSKCEQIAQYHETSKSKGKILYSYILVEDHYKFATLSIEPSLICNFVVYVAHN